MERYPAAAGSPRSRAGPRRGRRRSSIPGCCASPAGLAARGVSVVTFEFPYMQAAGRVRTSAPVLEARIAQSGKKSRATRRPDTPAASPAASPWAAASPRRSPPRTGSRRLRPGSSSSAIRCIRPTSQPNGATRICRASRADAVPPRHARSVRRRRTRCGRSSRRLPTSRSHLIEGGDHSLQRSRRWRVGGRAVGLRARLDLSIEVLHACIAYMPCPVPI